LVVKFSPQGYEALIRQHAGSFILQLMAIYSIDLSAKYLQHI